jgi:hypothetical protein
MKKGLLPLMQQPKNYAIAFHQILALSAISRARSVFSRSRFQLRPLENALQLILQFQPINPVIPGEASSFASAAVQKGASRETTKIIQHGNVRTPPTPHPNQKFADQNCTVISPGTLHFHATSATSCESNVASRYGSQASQLLGNLLSQRHLSNTFCTWD